MRFPLRYALALLSLMPAWAGAGGSGAALRELPAPAAKGALLTALAVDGQGTPVLAWTAPGPHGNRELHAAGWQEGRWVALGSVLNEGPTFNAAQLTARTDPGGQVWLGWAEDAGLAHVDSYLLSRWNGEKWSDPGHYAVRRNLSDAGRSRAFAVLPGGTPTLAWTDLGVRGAYAGVVRPLAWQGNTWVPQPLLSRTTRAGFSPDLAVNRAGRRSVVFLEGDFATMSVRVRQETPSGGWSDLGGALNRRPHAFAASPRLALGPDGAPVVAWLEEDAAGHDRVNVSRWTAGHWERLGGPASAGGVSTEALALAATPEGQPVLAWLEDGHLRAARWEAGQWQALPLPATTQAGGLSLSADGAYLGVSDGGKVRVWRLASPLP